MAKKSLYERTGKSLKQIAEMIGAIVAIIGAITGVCSWVSSQFQNAVSSQISGFQQEMKDANQRQEQALTRVELMVLMEHDPDNIVAIEKMARYYFQELNGDLYMTQRYSDWAKTHGGDTSIVIGSK